MKKKNKGQIPPKILWIVMVIAVIVFLYLVLSGKIQISP